MEIVNLLEYTEREQLREWLLANHAEARQCWVAIYRGKTKPEGACLPYIEVVEESLCLAQRLSPRRKGSHWTELNIQRCREMIKNGRMTAAGLQAMPKQ